VTYQEIAKIMGLPLSGNYMGREIGEIIGEDAFWKEERAKVYETWKVDIVEK